MLLRRLKAAAVIYSYYILSLPARGSTSHCSPAWHQQGELMVHIKTVILLVLTICSYTEFSLFSSPSTVTQWGLLEGGCSAEARTCLPGLAHSRARVCQHRRQAQAETGTSPTLWARQMTRQWPDPGTKSCSLSATPHLAGATPEMCLQTEPWNWPSDGLVPCQRAKVKGGSWSDCGYPKFSQE